MFLLVQAHAYNRYEDLLTQYFQLRKRVFADRLGWRVTVSGDRELDSYDKLYPAYLLWCSEDLKQLYGSVRLMPTTGPTLLYDVFRKTFPDACDLIAPGIWEGTRMCVDDVAIAHDFPDMRPDRAFCLLLLALCEVALDNGIHTLISNYEPHMKRIYQRAGAEFDELGRSDGYGRFPVCCGVFEVSKRVLANMRSKLEIVQPLYQVPAFPSRAAPDAAELAA